MTDQLNNISNNQNPSRMVKLLPKNPKNTNSQEYKDINISFLPIVAYSNDLDLLTMNSTERKSESSPYEINHNNTTSSGAQMQNKTFESKDTFDLCQNSQSDSLNLNTKIYKGQDELDQDKKSTDEQT